MARHIAAAEQLPDFRSLDTERQSQKKSASNTLTKETKRSKDAKHRAPLEKEGQGCEIQSEVRENDF